MREDGVTGHVLEATAPVSQKAAQLHGPNTGVGSMVLAAQGSPWIQSCSYGPRRFQMAPGIPETRH